MNLGRNERFGEKVEMSVERVEYAGETLGMVVDRIVDRKTYSNSSW